MKKVLSRWFINSRDSYTKTSDSYRILLINVLTHIGIILLGTYMIVSYFDRDYFSLVLEFTLVASMIGSFIYLKITGKTEFPIAIAIVIIFFTSFNNILNGGFSNTGIFWTYTLPPIIYFLLGEKRGTYMVGSFITLIAIVTFLASMGYITLPYSTFVLIIYLVTLSVTSLLIYIYQSTNEKNLKSIHELLSSVNLLNRVIKLGSELNKSDEVYKSFIATIVDEFKFSSGAFYIFNESDATLNMVSSYNLGPKIIPYPPKIGLEQSLYLPLLQGKEPIFINNLKAAKKEKEEENQSMAAVPLIYDGKLYGAIIINSNTPHLFTRLEKVSLVSAGEEIVNFVQKALKK